MIRATTPTHTFHFPAELEVGIFTKIQVTYSQCGCKVLVKTRDQLYVDTENNDIAVSLTQPELNLFHEGLAEIQVRVKDGGGHVAASNIIRVKVKKTLNQEVL